jgi:methyl-accepting chemotaxis protein
MENGKIIEKLKTVFKKTDDKNNLISYFKLFSFILSIVLLFNANTFIFFYKEYVIPTIILQLLFFLSSVFFLITFFLSQLSPFNFFISRLITSLNVSIISSLIYINYAVIDNVSLKKYLFIPFKIQRIWSEMELTEILRNKIKMDKLKTKNTEIYDLSNDLIAELAKKAKGSLSTLEKLYSAETQNRMILFLESQERATRIEGSLFFTILDKISPTLCDLAFLVPDTIWMSVIPVVLGGLYHFGVGYVSSHYFHMKRAAALQEYKQKTEEIHLKIHEHKQHIDELKSQMDLYKQNTENVDLKMDEHKQYTESFENQINQLHNQMSELSNEFSTGINQLHGLLNDESQILTTVSQAIDALQEQTSSLVEQVDNLSTNKNSENN